MKDQIEEMAKIIARRSKAFRNPNVAFMTTATKTAESLYNADYRKQEWISVDDRLPENIDSYLVVVKLKYPYEKEWEYDVDVAEYNPLENGYIDHWNTWNDWNEGQECHITHWMPLPEPPKMKGGAE